MPLFAILLALSLFVTPAVDIIDDPAPPVEAISSSMGYVQAIQPLVEPSEELRDKPAHSVGNGQCIDYVKYRLGYAVVEWVSAKNFYENYADYQFIKLDRATETAVVVTNESASWHVAIVESVTADGIVISEQNYIKGTIGERTLSRDDTRIMGYFVWEK